MPPRSETKRARLKQWIEEHLPTCIDGAAFAEIRASIGPVSESYLRLMVRDLQLPMSADVEGVVTSCLTDLRRTLTALAHEYASGRKDVRAIVIDAKNRLKWAEARATDPQKKAIRAEMVLWTMTWLENPDAFEVWVELREKATA
jgi:hypothetical protein